MNFKIITDSTADICPEILEKYNITVASLDVIMDGKPQKAVDVPNEVFYSHLNECLVLIVLCFTPKFQSARVYLAFSVW